jgi:hypothetical protein
MSDIEEILKNKMKEHKDQPWYVAGFNAALAVLRRAAGRDWLQQFMRQHPTICQRKLQKNLNKARARKLNKVVVGDYFKKLKKLLETNNLQHSPERIYDLDEKGI